MAIDRRSGLVADYVGTYLGREQRQRFEEVVRTKVRLMVELREVQEKVGRHLIPGDVLSRYGWGTPSWSRSGSWRRTEQRT